tara:strand:- start:2232 stop:2492 length:261 start_codon:yes stop_codon:yes gene_type:complete
MDEEEYDLIVPLPGWKPASVGDFVDVTLKGKLRKRLAAEARARKISLQEHVNNTLREAQESGFMTPTIREILQSPTKKVTVEGDED